MDNNIHIVKNYIIFYQHQQPVLIANTGTKIIWNRYIYHFLTKNQNRTGTVILFLRNQYR